MHAGPKVLMEVDDNISLNVGNLQGILYGQLRPYQIQPLNIFITYYLISYYINYIIIEIFLKSVDPLVQMGNEHSLMW